MDLRDKSGNSEIIIKHSLGCTMAIGYLSLVCITKKKIRINLLLKIKDCKGFKQTINFIYVSMDFLDNSFNVYTNLRLKHLYAISSSARAMLVRRF